MIKQVYFRIIQTNRQSHLKVMPLTELEADMYDSSNTILKPAF